MLKKLSVTDKVVLVLIKKGDLKGVKEFGGHENLVKLGLAKDYELTDEGEEVFEKLIEEDNEYKQIHRLAP